MNTIPQIFVGIDVAKDFYDIHLHPLNKAFRITNDKKGISKLLRILSKYQVQLVVFESSGGYGYFLSKELLANGYKTWQVDPSRIKAFIASEGVHAKTDKIDAKMIALFASQKELKYEKNEPTEIEECLRALVKRRQNLVQMIIIENNRVKHPAQIFCKDRINNHIIFMKDEIYYIEEEIDQLINNNDMFNLKAAIITSIPGLGKVSAFTLIAGLPELGKIADKQISALVGVAPFTQQSGASKGTAIIRGGRKPVRNTLYMATLTALQYNPIIKEFYDRLRRNGKKPKVAIVAAMRKLIIILNTMVKKNEMWDPQSN